MNSSRSGLSYQHLSMLVLAIATAIIHVFLALKAFGMNDMTTTIMFTLNGVGYIGLLAAYLLPLPFLSGRRGLVRWAFLAYTAVTILAWVAIGDKSLPAGMLGYITKAIELVLFALLWMDKRN
jgi:hypothetical protein